MLPDDYNHDSFLQRDDKSSDEESSDEPILERTNSSKQGILHDVEVCILCTVSKHSVTREEIYYKFDFIDLVVGTFASVTILERKGSS